VFTVFEDETADLQVLFPMSWIRFAQLVTAVPLCTGNLCSVESGSIAASLSSPYLAVLESELQKKVERKVKFDLIGT